jgi:predicted nucleic acid-binding Zn ribbon protein
MAHPSLAARVIAEWRGYEEPPAGPERCAPVGDILAKLLPRYGLADRLDEAEVLAAWREVVGDFLADNASPAGLARGTLTVTVLQPSVRYELERHWKPVILEKLRARFGQRTVREIRFRLG